jgi:hypothetical protein
MSKIEAEEKKRGVNVDPKIATRTLDYYPAWNRRPSKEPILCTLQKGGMV